MAKKKDVKPLFAVKHDFVESLDRLSHESIMLLQAIEMAIDRGAVHDSAKDILRERAKAFRAALSSDE